MIQVIIPEEILSQVINNRLDFIRKNPDYLNDIFANLSDDQMIRLNAYITGNQTNNISAVNVIRGYPQTIEHLPSYVIVLGKEEESHDFLNNFVADDDASQDFSYQEVTDTVKIMSRHGQKYIRLNHAPQSFQSAVYKGITYTPDCFVQLDPNNSNFADLIKDPRVIGLSSLVISDLKNTAEIEVHYQAITSMANRYGSIFKSSYQVQVWTQNGDLTVWLYHLLKWIFQIDRNYLQDSGFLTIHYSGGEFEPFKPDQTYPAMIYRRAFVLDFETNVFPVGMDKTIDNIKTSIPSDSNS